MSLRPPDGLARRKNHGAAEDVEHVAKRIGDLNHVARLGRLEVFVILFGHQSMPEFHFSRIHRRGRNVSMRQAEGLLEQGHRVGAFFEGHADKMGNIF